MILLRVQIILDNFLATISKGQSCGQNVNIVAQRAVALPFSFFSAENTRCLKMIIIVRGIFRHFSLHEGQEKQPSLGPQFLPGLFIFSYIHLGNMKILLTMAIVLGALIIVQASSSKEFTLVDTVKNCNCMDYLK